MMPPHTLGHWYSDYFELKTYGEHQTQKEFSPNSLYLLGENCPLNAFNCHEFSVQTFTLVNEDELG